MSAQCCGSSSVASGDIDPNYRNILWIALLANAAMFAVEIGGSVVSGSMSLLADAVDFAGDAANYGLSLAVLSMGLIWRARAALVKGISMAAFGIFVLGRTAWLAVDGRPPDPITMGTIALLALTVNVGVAVLLFKHRRGDANMRSVWLCSRNDALGNVAVMIAAAGVFGTGSGWPDLVVATLMAALALSAGASVVRMACQEITTAGIRAAEISHGPGAVREH